MIAGITGIMIIKAPIIIRVMPIRGITAMAMIKYTSYR